MSGRIFPSPLALPYPCRLAVLRGCAESCAAGALACGMILFPVPPSCPSRFPQLNPCGVLSLLCLFFYAGAALIETVNQLAGAVGIHDGCNEPGGRRGKKKEGGKQKEKRGRKQHIQQ